VSAIAVALSLLLASLLAFAAGRKLSHRPDVVAAYARVGVPEHQLNRLAFLLLLGAGGLVIGLVWAPLGIAAAACLVAYFLLAVAAHVRHADKAHLPTPLVLLTLAVAVLLLRLAI
jgi:hypothetical protein